MMMMMMMMMMTLAERLEALNRNAEVPRERWTPVPDSYDGVDSFLTSLPASWAFWINPGFW